MKRNGYRIGAGDLFIALVRLEGSEMVDVKLSVAMFGFQVSYLKKKEVHFQSSK